MEGKLASSPISGKALRRLLAQKEIASLATRCGHQVTSFQYLVYLLFCKEELPKRSKPNAASSLATAEDLLDLMDFLQALKRRHDAGGKAYDQDFYGWILPAWEANVQQLGLSLEDYAAVRDFKGHSDGSVYIDEDERPEEVLRALESSVFPEELKPFKQPLINMLRILTGAGREEGGIAWERI